MPRRSRNQGGYWHTAAPTAFATYGAVRHAMACIYGSTASLLRCILACRGSHRLCYGLGTGPATQLGLVAP